MKGDEVTYVAGASDVYYFVSQEDFKLDLVVD